VKTAKSEIIPKINRNIGTRILSNPRTGSLKSSKAKRITAKEMNKGTIRSINIILYN